MPEHLVHVVDDDTPFRQSVALMLAECGYAVMEHSDGWSFVRAVQARAVGCGLVDVSLPDLDGIELQQMLKDRGITVPLVFMTDRAAVPTVVRAMKAGAIDFIEKPFERRTLLSAIDAALARYDATEDPELAEFRTRLARLSHREREVLDGIVAGLPTRVIAYRLGISPRTVDAHRAKIGARLHVSGLPNLIRLSLAAGVTGEPKH
ncbi:response regulator [Azospirillum sp. TSO22-1]|uniref:response regulator transcription factor n=1 Tax=Azospirillum sp. TSO22-1 TaxID=716789 RepID=UPI000D622A02|nr:response regulator [Azospirillum sp. TSO22-1]PWC52650.1 hypothetical protein TSO221_13555 [Azospirillum sp. TSO22-1]